ncbi:MAG: [FeFe] hydrogenase H-cluster radical SAM maturase HydE [candidate division WOR-3 bacterium]
MTRSEILNWLQEDDSHRLRELAVAADRVRREHVGDEVYLRGLIEISNYCRCNCLYCGIRASRRIERYRLSEDEIIGCCRQAAELGYGTVVLQSGEDLGLTAGFISRVISRIRDEYGLAVTLSLGERTPAELAVWRRFGADRYLLKHETADARLFHEVHPGSSPEQRIRLLQRARELGYEIGSGVMVGIPGQTYESLADDIMLFQELDLDMIGSGPFIPHPDTPLGQVDCLAGEAPNSDLMTAKVIALSRMVCPEANIPATTALATVNPEAGRELGLCWGANVWMPDLTPERYRRLYDIYPGKADAVSIHQSHERLLASITAIGRRIGSGAGNRHRRHTDGV